MKNKKIFRTFAVLLAALICLGGFSVTAYADGGDYYDDVNDEPIPEETTESQPLTPEGNMSLVDDIEGEAAEDKQFIVVKSKSGNYFYIIVDRAAEGENSVHFLNQVDEADLMAIIEDGQTEQAPAVCTCTDKCKAGQVNMNCAVCATNMTECAGKEAEPEPDEPTDEPQEKESGGMGGLVVFLIVALLGGGAFYYFKFMKPKQSAKGGTDLDDFDFEEYDEEADDEYTAELESIAQDKQEEDEE